MYIHVDRVWDALQGTKWHGKLIFPWKARMTLPIFERTRLVQDLVGGFNPSEKHYVVKIGSFPQVGVKIKNPKDGWFGYYISNFGEDPSELP